MRRLTSSKHDRWVAGVGAAGDGSDDHGAVAELIIISIELEVDLSALMLRSHLETLEALLEMITDVESTRAVKITINHKTRAVYLFAVC